MKLQNDTFMQTVLVIIENNISNPSFSIIDMSRNMDMSRVALYKKILKLTCKSPLEFFRQVRLKKAAHLLENTDMTVAQVAHQVGFNNRKYFSKHFKAEYHQLPSAYIQEKRMKLKNV